MTDSEQVVMTPKSRTENSTTLLIERRIVNNTEGNVHVAGGEHTGIIINKDVATKENGVDVPAQLSLQFSVYLVDSQTGKHTQESRILRFWFRPPKIIESAQYVDDAAVAQDFFRELVSPVDFPRDYVGFIKKIIKIMQRKYETISKLEVELTRLKDASMPVAMEERQQDQKLVLSTDKILELIESAYPNPIKIQDISSNGWNETDIIHHLTELQSKGLVKEVERGAFTRQQSLDSDFRVVEQMPTMASAKQPTIAIITAQYCEKLAVDAMIENKETFVRYTTIGESNVYTLGNIGAHRVVCTKLPSVGHTREAMTAAGSTTTRLLGTFQKVEHVFLVGLGGGVPHYTDYNRHVRLGDVVVSYPTKTKGVYLYCETATPNEKSYSFEVKSYSPMNLVLQDITKNLVNALVKIHEAPWVKYIKDGLRILAAQPDANITLPNIDTDKLYMSIGETDLIEVSHPLPNDKNTLRSLGCPVVHLSPIASGRLIVRDDRLRQLFATEVGALAFDCEYDAVIESIQGNCKDSFVCIRGISDYKDGTKRKDWQPYASLAAASVMKAIISYLEPNEQ